MVKDSKFQVRISSELLDEFDAVVGNGNRSRIIVNFIKDIVNEQKQKENGKNIIFRQSQKDRRSTASY